MLRLPTFKREHGEWMGHVDQAAAKGSTQPTVNGSLADAGLLRIIDAASVLLWIGAPDGTRRWVGQGLSAFTGLPSSALCGQAWTNAIHPEDAERCKGIDTVCLATNRKFSLEYRLRHHDGSYLWMLDSVVPVLDAAGALEGHVGVCVDIHQRRLAEEDLAERMRKVRLSNRL